MPPNSPDLTSGTLSFPRLDRHLPGAKCELLILHNAGSLGRLAYSHERPALEASIGALDLNVTGFVVLSQMLLQRFAPQARLRLYRARRIVDARVDHLGVPARYLGTDELVAFDDQHLPTPARQFPANGKSDHAGADDHGCATFSHLERGRASSARSPGTARQDAGDTRSNAWFRPTEHCQSTRCDLLCPTRSEHS